MLFFGQRKKLAAKFEQWCKENNILCCATSMVGFLQGNDLLNEERITEYLTAIDKPDEKHNGLKEFTV